MKDEKYKTRTTKLKSIDTIGIFATTSRSITLSLTGFSLIVIPISSSIACGLSLTNKALYEIVMQNIIKTKNYKKKINKQLKLLINYIVRVYKII